MFFSDKDINNGTLKIDNIMLSTLGLSPIGDIEFPRPKKEYELKYIPGRDLPYRKIIRNSPMEMTIDFNLKCSSQNFNNSLLRVENLINNSNGKVLHLSNQRTGYKIYFGEVLNSSQHKTGNTCSIYFMLEPTIVNVNGGGYNR